MPAPSSAPTALVIVESYYGSTRIVAQAVADGLSDAGVEVRLLDAERAPTCPPDDLDLLVLAAPTHNRGLPSTRSRMTVKKSAEPGTVADSGIREWLEAATIPAGASVIVFDTVTSRSWLSGSAAQQVVKILATRRPAIRASARSFVVAGTSSGLVDGEVEQARAWGRELAVAG